MTHVSMHSELSIDTNQGQQGLAHLVELIRKFEAATLITRRRAGTLHGRPMTIGEVEASGTISFVTSLASAKVGELADDSRATVTLQGAGQFVCMNGHLELVFDRVKVQSVWKDSYGVWYEGEGDPEIVLLRFTPFDAEYWDALETRGLRFAFEAARAFVFGENAQPKQLDPESHAKLRLWEPAAVSKP